MKKIALFAGFSLLTLHNTYAQGFFYRLGIGYAIPQAGQTMDGTAIPYNGTMNNAGTGSSATVSYDLKKASFSSGINGTVGVGYLFNEHVGIDVALSGMLGAQKYSFYENNIAVNNIASDVEITQHASCTLFTPSLLMQTNGKINLYTRVGVAVPIKTRIYQDQIVTNLPGTGAIEADDFYSEIKNSFNLGFSGAAGANFKVNRRFNVYAEASFLSLAVFAKESDLKEVYVNGQGGYLQYVSVSQRKIVYSDNFTATSGDNFHQPTYAQPFSNMSFNVGLYYSLHTSHGATQRAESHSSRR